MLSNARDCTQAPTYPTGWGWKLPTRICWAVLNTESIHGPSFLLSSTLHWLGNVHITEQRLQLGFPDIGSILSQLPTTLPASQSNQTSRSFCWNPIITFHTFNSLLKRGWKPTAPMLLSTNMDLELVPKTFRIVLPLFYATHILC